jgi:hypothetical protein
MAVAGVERFLDSRNFRTRWGQFRDEVAELQEETERLRVAWSLGHRRHRA